MELDLVCQLAAKNWRTLNSLITTLTESQLNALLNHEKATRKRMDMMVRIQQRLNNVIGSRKLEELEKEFGGE